MKASVPSGCVLLIVLMVASGCGDAAETTASGSAQEAVTTAAPAPTAAPTTLAPTTTTTTTAPTTTTTTSTTTTTTPTTTTTTTATTPTLRTAAAHALGTFQLVFIPFGDGVALPQPPIAGSVRIEGNGGSVTVRFEDPDPGFASNDDGTLSITVRTFAAALAPGSYQIDSIELIDDAFGANPVNVALFPPFMPRFTVLPGAECTFVGDMSLFWWRLAPGDMGVELANELGTEQGISLVFLDSGSLAYGGAGMDLLADVIEGDMSGNSWWLDGTEIDGTNCVDVPAEF